MTSKVVGDSFALLRGIDVNGGMGRCFVSCEESTSSSCRMSFGSMARAMCHGEFVARNKPVKVEAPQRLLNSYNNLFSLFLIKIFSKVLKS